MDDESDLWSIAQNCPLSYPSSDDFIDVSFDAQIEIFKCMVTTASAKAGWGKLDKYPVADKKEFCRELIRHVINVRCSYAISRREGKKDRIDRFKALSKAVSLINLNLSTDGEFFRECRLAQSEKNSMFAAQLKQAMAPHLKRLAPESKFIDSILMEEVFKLLEDNPFSMLEAFNENVKKLASEPPLTTSMNNEESERIYFQKAMTQFFIEKFDKPLYGVTTDFSNALFSDSITEVKVRDRVKKK